MKVTTEAVPMDAELRRRLGQVAHDLNTPLSAVRLQLYLHRKSLAAPTPQDLRSLEILERNIERIQKLVAGMVPPAAPPAF